MPMSLRVESRIAFGGFCRVYIAQVNASGVVPVESKVALKKMHVTKHVKNPVLLHEAAALLMLKGHETVPAVYAWGRSQYYEYLALQLLGGTIAGFSGAPTMRNLVAITRQMFDAIEHVHKHNLIHGDIKPGNFLFGAGKDIGRVYLIDYGLAKWYADPQTSEHIPDGRIPSMRGTSVYASLNMHYLRMPSRRDDMESLAYTILGLLRGDLPWRQVWQHDQLLSLKATWTGLTLCGEYPPVFGEFLDYTRDLRFEEAPDYKTWRARFRSLVPGKEEPLLYDPSDRDSPLVGHVCDAATPCSAQPAPAPEAKHDYSIPSSDDGWCLRSTWPAPESVKEEDLLGGERKVVARALETFAGLPEMDKPYLDPGCQTEVLEFSVAMVHHDGLLLP